MQVPVDGLSLRLQFRRLPVFHRAAQRLLMLPAQCPQFLVRGGPAEERYRFPLDEQTELEGFADQIEIDMRDLEATLRHRLYQTLGFQTRDEFADCAKRHAGHGDQLPLGDELARMKVTRQQMLGEALIGFVP